MPNDQPKESTNTNTQSQISNRLAFSMFLWHLPQNQYIFLLSVPRTYSMSSGTACKRHLQTLNSFSLICPWASTRTFQNPILGNSGNVKVPDKMPLFSSSDCHFRMMQPSGSMMNQKQSVTLFTSPRGNGAIPLACHAGGRGSIPTVSVYLNVLFLPLRYRSWEKIEMVLSRVQISRLNKSQPCHLWANIEISARSLLDLLFFTTQIPNSDLSSVFNRWGFLLPPFAAA